MTLLPSRLVAVPEPLQPNPDPEHGTHNLDNFLVFLCLSLPILFADPEPAESGPHYTQLGAAESLAALRLLMERRTGLAQQAIRLEEIVFTGKEGKTSQGCPVAKWVRPAPPTCCSMNSFRLQFRRF